MPLTKPELRMLLDKNLLADAVLATELRRQESAIELQKRQMQLRLEELEENRKKIQAARDALDLPATYQYRRNSRSFRALVKGNTFTEIKARPEGKKAGRPK